MYWVTQFELTRAIDGRLVDTIHQAEHLGLSKQFILNSPYQVNLTKLNTVYGNSLIY